MEQLIVNPAWHIDQNRAHDVICMGRVAVDLYSEQVGCSLEESKNFRKYLGGCAGNIAVGSSRLGLRSAMFSCVGSDAMGQFLKQELEREGVDITLVNETANHLTGLVLLGIHPPDRFPLIFYRTHCADMQIKIEDVKSDFIAQSKTLLFTGTGLSTESMRATTHYAVAIANSVKTRVIFDLDYRPVLWGLTNLGDGETRYKSSQQVSLAYQAILPDCDLIVGTEEEFLIASNTETLEQAISSTRQITTAPLVLKRGAQGCCIYLDDLTHPIISRPFPVKVLNVLGAGDGFMSGFLCGLLHGNAWDICAMYGNACGAIVVTRHGCAPAMPYYNEMRDFIAKYAEHKECENNMEKLL
jgi:5-dehydro-2-deoxygluconokinase